MMDVRNEEEKGLTDGLPVRTVSWEYKENPE